MKSNKIRVLVVSYIGWRNDTNIGNTISNLFCGLEDRIEFANIYFKGGAPLNNIVNRYFYISEKELAKSIVTRQTVGSELLGNNMMDKAAKDAVSAVYDKARQVRWESLLLAQDLIGLLGKWKSTQLNEFVEKFKPDLIFGPLGRVPVANDLMAFLSETYKIPLVTYAWDDHYSFNKRSISPFFWIKTVIEHNHIKRCAETSAYLYAITEEMCESYSKYFKKECKVLYKGYSFKENEYIPPKTNKGILRFLYMGNIGAGRWQELAGIAKAIKRVNKTNIKAQLYMYTMSPCSSQIKDALNIENSSFLNQAVSPDKVLSYMKNADILLHVEPTNIKELSSCKQSFSTKIVDYLYCGRCILAIGGDTAATSYLKKNDAAIIEHNPNCYYDIVKHICENRDMIVEYAKKARLCGEKNHQINSIQEGIYRDFVTTIEQ